MNQNVNASEGNSSRWKLASRLPFHSDSIQYDCFQATFLIFQSKLNPLSSQEKQMEVCEICGAFLIVGDAQSRVDDHLQGKQHVGYARIKATVEEMRVRTVILSLVAEELTHVAVQHDFERYSTLYNADHQHN